MKLLETYSRNCSVNIKHKPFLAEKYFPLDFDRYITFQIKSGMPAKDYTYYQEIINLIAPILAKENIRIVLLGKDDDSPVFNVVDLRNKTSYHQAFYVLKRGLLHCGVDSWLCHVAGAENIPLVALYGSTTVKNHSPYFFDPNKTIFLESDRNGFNASFAREENPKMVDRISPETIVSSIFKLLNIPFDYPYKTLNIGPLYHIRLIENVPDQVINVSNLNLTSLIQRMDILFNEQNTFEQLKLVPLSILLDKPINEQILSIHRERIIEVIYKITKEHNPSFIKLLNKHKIKYRLFSDLPAEILNPIKLHYMDFSIIQSVNKDRIDIIKDEDINNGNIYYKSSKILLGRGKIYQSKMDYLNSREIPSFESIPLQVTNNQHLNELWAEKDFLYFLKKV